MGVTGFTRKMGVFFAYGVDGREFFPALYSYPPSSICVSLLHALPQASLLSQNASSFMVAKV